MLPTKIKYAVMGNASSKNALPIKLLYVVFVARLSVANTTHAPLPLAGSGNRAVYPCMRCLFAFAASLCCVLRWYIAALLRAYFTQRPMRPVL